LSRFFRRHRQVYYELLQRIRTHGDWEEWLRFFLRGVFETSREAVTTARSMLDLFREDKSRLTNLGRASGSALRLHAVLRRRPLLRIGRAAEITGLTEPTIAASVARLEGLGIVREITGRQRGRIYRYSAYLDLLEGKATGPINPDPGP
jgi:Fic family protein